MPILVIFASNVVSESPFNLSVSVCALKRTLKCTMKCILKVPLQAYFEASIFPHCLRFVLSTACLSCVDGLRCEEPIAMRHTRISLQSEISQDSAAYVHRVASSLCQPSPCSHHMVVDNKYLQQDAILLAQFGSRSEHRG